MVKFSSSLHNAPLPGNPAQTANTGRVLQKQSSISNFAKRLSGKFSRQEIDQSFKDFRGSEKDSMPAAQKTKAEIVDRAVRLSGAISTGKKDLEAFAHKTSHDLDAGAKSLNSVAKREKLQQALPEGLKTSKKSKLIDKAKIETAKAEVSKLKAEMGNISEDEEKLANLQKQIQHEDDPDKLQTLNKELDALSSKIENKFDVAKARMKNIQGTFSDMRAKMSVSVAKYSLAHTDQKVSGGKSDSQKQFSKEVSASIKEFTDILAEQQYVQSPLNYEDAVNYVATKSALKNLDVPQGSSPLAKQFHADVTELKESINGFREMMKEIDPKATLTADQIKDLKTEGGTKRLADNLAESFLRENKLPPRPAEGTSQAYQAVLRSMGEKVLSSPDKNTFLITGSTTPILVASLPGKDNVKFAYKFRPQDGFEGREDSSKFSYMEHLGYSHPLSTIGSAQAKIKPSDLPTTTYRDNNGEEQNYSEFVQQFGVSDASGKQEFLVEEFVPNNGTLQNYTLSLNLPYDNYSEVEKQTVEKGPERFLALFSAGGQASNIENMTIKPKELGTLQQALKDEGRPNDYAGLAITINDTATQNNMLNGLALNETFPEEVRNQIAQEMGIPPERLGKNLSETTANFEKTMKETTQDKVQINKARDELKEKGLTAIKKAITDTIGPLSTEQKQHISGLLQQSDKTEYLQEADISEENFNNSFMLNPEEQKSLENFIEKRETAIASGSYNKKEFTKEFEDLAQPIMDRHAETQMQLKHSERSEKSKELGFDYKDKDFFNQPFFKSADNKNAAEAWSIRYLNDDIRNQDDNLGGILLQTREDGTVSLKSIDFEESRPRMELATDGYRRETEASKALVGHENALRLPAETKEKLLKTYADPAKMVNDLKRQVAHTNPELASKREIHPEGYEMDGLVNYDFERAGKHAIRAHLQSEPEHDDPNYDKWAQINVRGAVIDQFQDFWIKNGMAGLSESDKEAEWTKFEKTLVGSFQKAYQS